MKKIITALLLCIVLTTPALAAEKTGNVGINVSFDNAFGVQGEFKLEKSLSLQAFLKSYSRNYDYGNAFGSYSYRYTAIGAAGIYDFSKEIRLPDKKIHPYAGLGIYTVNAAFSGSGGVVSSPVNGGLYLTFGARYELTPTIDFDGNYNNFGGLTFGANLKF